MQNWSISSGSGCAMTPVLRPEPRPRFRRGPVSGGTSQASIVPSGFLAEVASPSSPCLSGMGLSWHARGTEAPPKGGAATPETARNRPEGIPVSLELADRLEVHLDARPAEPLAACPRALEARRHALADDVAFELGHRADDREHRLADRARGVELLLERDEGDVHAPEGVERRHEVLDGSREAVEAPHRSEEHTSELQSQSNLVC